MSSYTIETSSPLDASGRLDARKRGFVDCSDLMAPWTTNPRGCAPLLLSFTSVFYVRRKRVVELSVARSFVQRTVKDEMIPRLLTPFFESELLAAQRALPRDNCRGEDGLLPAFVLRHYDLLKRGYS